MTSDYLIHIGRDRGRPSNQDLPKSIQILVDCIGFESTMKFISSIAPVYDSKYKRYIRQIYIPKQFNKLNKTIRHMILVVGEHHAKTIVFLYGGDCLRPAICKSYATKMRNAVIQSELASGKEIKVVAQQFGLSISCVRKVWNSPHIKVLSGGGGVRAETGPAVSCVSGV
jgi:hypothetical protein